MSFPGAKAGSHGAGDRPKGPRVRAATWSHRETLDFLALWGEEGIQAQLNRCHRNADVYQWISERMAEKGYSRDEDQCRTKGKDLKKSYKQAKLQEGPARQRCRFFHELEAILGGGRGGRGGTAASQWCQVVVKEEQESDPDLDPDPEKDSSDVEPPPASSLAAASSSSSSSSQTVEPLLRPRVIKEERSPPPEEEGEEGKDTGFRGGGGACFTFPAEVTRRDCPGIPQPREREEPQRGGGPEQEEEGAPPGRSRPAFSRKAFSRPRSLLSTREKLTQLRNRRKRPRDDRFDELIRDIRTHFRERERLFHGLWEEEKAQREKDRRHWMAEIAWIREMWAKSQKEREATAAGEDKQTNGPRHIEEENLNRNLSKKIEGMTPKDTGVQEPLLLKVAYAKSNSMGEKERA